MMTRIFIDITEEEQHWNGETGIRIFREDGLSGADMAIAFGEHQLVLTTSQGVTLYELLDSWMNDGTAKQAGQMRQRMLKAIRSLIEERRGIWGRMFTPTFTEEMFVRDILDHMQVAGLRVRSEGEEPL